MIQNKQKANEVCIVIKMMEKKKQIKVQDQKYKPKFGRDKRRERMQRSEAEKDSIKDEAGKKHEREGIEKEKRQKKRMKY